MSAYNYFTGNSFEQLYKPDFDSQEDYYYTFLLFYPTTAAWSNFKNDQKYIIQDGNEEEKKVEFDKVMLKEAWKNMALLGKTETFTVQIPPKELIEYWEAHLGNELTIYQIKHNDHYRLLNQNDLVDKYVTLFPHDHLLPEKHAVDPDVHYELLSKLTLDKMGFPCPKHTAWYFSKTDPKDVDLPKEFPYAVKTSHGLSGEGTYLIHSQEDLENCRKEFRAYWNLNLVKAVVVSDFVKNVVDNYCVQFYVNFQGEVTLLGATHQIVTSKGEYLGGQIDYEEDLQKFDFIIKEAASFAHQKGYFGVIGLDVLEDTEGNLSVIDANIRINGSTGMCILRNMLLALGKRYARYSGGFYSYGSLSDFLKRFETELQNKDFILLSSVEKEKDGKKILDMYGILAAKNKEELDEIAEKLEKKGLFHA